MDNQHPRITGYRALSEVDIALMNRIKEQGPWLEEMIEAVGQHTQAQRLALVGPQQLADINHAQPERWTAIARTHFQQGLMALTRAVAQPTNF